MRATGTAEWGGRVRSKRHRMGVLAWYRLSMCEWNSWRRAGRCNGRSSPAKVDRAAFAESATNSNSANQRAQQKSGINN